MGVFTAALAVVALSCAHEVPHPPYTSQTTADLELVGYPPPPARVEFIPTKPRAANAWIDGEWGWTGSKWTWTAGRWVSTPPSARFSPWTTVRDGQGDVYFASGVWRDARGAKIPSPAPLATGRSTPGDVTSPEGDDEKTAASPPPGGGNGKP
jgi:hypothetical protein